MVFLSFGFRPFFLLGALWAALAMVLWVGMLAGRITLPMVFAPVDWHAHAFIFGYLGAVVSGFLLTAVPNWTGRPPLAGWHLGLMVLLWVAGRAAVSFSALLPFWFVVLVDLSSLVMLVTIVTREIVTAGNWRNLVVVGMLLMLIAGAGLFHWQAAQGEAAARSEGFRLMLAAAVMMISLIGGRIIPTFTRNWLEKTGKVARPAPPMMLFDKLALAVTLAALIAWVLAPWSAVTGPALIVMGVVQAIRLSRWCGLHGASEPLIWSLHAGYGFVPLGAVILGLALLWPDRIDPASGQHLWMAGAIGVMTLAVMTRATLGHTGQALTAGPGTTVLYVALIAAVLLRLIAGFSPGIAQDLHMLSGGLWCLGFLGFSLAYGRLLVGSGSPR
ncbi:NnrS family protein [Roseovarius sp. MMSF_3359]|uniref:NnrS family protein n=1 Tax=Roseovarius sp. MMSF_3359 TaxID=3046707 RepID=UPI00273DAC7B|nr:NnrS family protein [Roseovarius sp. MMSF_3359]